MHSHMIIYAHMCTFTCQHPVPKCIVTYACRHLCICVVKCVHMGMQHISVYMLTCVDRDMLKFVHMW